MLKLYDYFRSSACFRVRIALNLKGLDYQTIPVHLVNNGGEHRTAEYKELNPQGLVPTLQDGDKVITQSLVIIDYLNELHPEPPLLPADAYQRALTKSFALEIAADLHPLNNLRVLNYLTHDLTLTDEKKNQWYQHWMHLGLSALEKKLTALNTKTDYCFGQTPTLADVCLVPQMYNARRFNCDLTEFPTLVRIDAHCQQHPAFHQAWPKES